MQRRLREGVPGKESPRVYHRRMQREKAAHMNAAVDVSTLGCIIESLGDALL